MSKDKKPDIRTYEILKNPPPVVGGVEYSYPVVGKFTILAEDVIPEIAAIATEVTNEQ